MERAATSACARAHLSAVSPLPFCLPALSLSLSSHAVDTASGDGVAGCAAGRWLGLDGRVALAARAREACHRRRVREGLGLEERDASPPFLSLHFSFLFPVIDTAEAYGFGLSEQV